jgi:DNA-binding NarL/FixJ family response regulator
VIGLSVQDDEATAASMRSAGAAAFVPKAGDAIHLLRTIHSVAAAEHAVDAN